MARTAQLLALLLTFGQALAQAARPPARAIVLPFENLSGNATIGREITTLAAAALAARGYRIADPGNLEAVLEDERIRYLDSLTPPQLARLVESSAAEVVLLGSVYAYDDGANPIVAVAMRLVGKDGRLRWWDVEATSAEDTVGVLGVGRVDTAAALARHVVRRLAERLPTPGESRGIAGVSKPVFLKGPVSWRSPYLPRDDSYRVVILPLDGWIGSGTATKVVAALLARRLEATGHFHVVEPAVVRRAMIDVGLWSVGALDPDGLRRLGERLGAPYFVRGTLHRFLDGRGNSSIAPRVELTLTMIDARRERIVWMGYHARAGDDYQGLLELGKVTTAVALADHVIGEMVNVSEASADRGKALTTVGRRHLREQEARAKAAAEAAAPTARAQAKQAKKLTPEEVATARAHVQKGMTAGEAGRTDEAVAELTKALEITEDPRLWFYVGSAHDRAGNLSEALAAYRRFVAEAKVGRDQLAPVQKRIKALEAELKAKPPDANPQPAAPSPSPPTP